ncbi:alpha-glucosidase [Petrotoga miotherma DSM 10691]|uniref:Alpha-glucosidase n=1 Tax=Petrotoga miotherma DSM 10691 TaxID=1434326 RepID=A0A2K1P706_9BACT|nr:alpha-glucosidase AglA [Petrotoga miotherma]PNR98497.1 alpha-glucosidase [Petrotoga miotherma DSM 10691]
MPVKISFIGAGSVRYTMKLVGDLAKTKELNGSLISFMDIDEERLNAVDNLAKRYTEEIGGNLKFEKTTNREESLKDADFVINTALYRAPGHEDGYVSYEIMRDVGEKYGYYRGIDSQEFNMVSDYYTFTNYNHLKLSLDIAKSIEKICPNAWLMQTANPVFEITQLIKRLTNVKVIGFCHGVVGVQEVLKTLGLEEKETDWQVAGVNHGIWLNRFLYKGEDGYQILDKWIEEESNNWEPKDPWDTHLAPAVIDMYKFYGLLPIGDTTRNSTWKHHHSLQAKKKWYGKFGGIDNEVERPKFYEELRQIKRMIIQVSKDPSIKITETWSEEFPKEKMSGEQQIPFINALTNDVEARLFLNVLNNGTIKNIPDDVVVEVPLKVNKNGMFPEKIEPDLPEKIKNYYIIPRITRMEMALESFITGDRNILEEVLVRDPRTKNYDDIPKLWDEIFDLPFNKGMKEHYRR